MTHADTYPDYTRGERIADAAVHAAGIAFAITATIVLIVLASGETNVGTVVALSIYGAALIGIGIAGEVQTPANGVEGRIGCFDEVGDRVKNGPPRIDAESEFDAPLVAQLA